MSSTDLAAPDKSVIRHLFDSIAHRYDFLNTLLSLRMDDYWRHKARRMVVEGSEKSLLDLGIGTGKFLKLFVNIPGLKRAVGMDFSVNMLKQCKETLKGNVGLVTGDFHALPFAAGSFDLVISSFTLRSVKEMSRFFLEVYEVLTPHGKAAFLCLTRPQNPIVKALYKPYLNFYLPWVGRTFSGSGEAYEFLSQSVQKFQDPRVTMEMLRRNGFQTIEVHRLTFGIATLIIAKK